MAFSSPHITQQVITHIKIVRIGEGSIAKKDEVIIMAPDMVNVVPFLRSVLPTRIFDFVAEKLGVYHSMEEFSGRSTTSSSTRIKVD